MPHSVSTEVRMPLFITVAAIVLAIGHLACGQYLQIYPEKGTGDGPNHLYFGLMQSFGGGFSASGTVPGVQVALDQINADPAMLPGYTLHYTLSDSQVSRKLYKT